MIDAAVYADVFLHVRVVMGIVVGLGIARLLNGAAYFLQHPGRRPASLIHLGWAGALLKGWQHRQELGPVYEVGLIGQCALCIAAIITANRRFHLAFAAVALAYQVCVILRLLGSDG